MSALRIAIVAASLTAGLFAVSGCETTHTESDRPTLFGGHKHEETTTTKNPITGDTSTSHSEERTR